MGKTLIKIGPADHGRRMSLEEFEHAEVQEGYLYELSRGIITVSDVPNRLHLLQLVAIRDQLQAYESLHPGRIHVIAGGSECKLLIPALDSERHPDLAVYLTLRRRIEDARLLASLGPRDRHRGRFAQLAEARLRREARGIPAARRQGILDRRRPQARDGRDAAGAESVGREQRSSLRPSTGRGCSPGWSSRAEPSSKRPGST